MSSIKLSQFTTLAMIYSYLNKIFIIFFSLLYTLGSISAQLVVYSDVEKNLLKNGLVDIQKLDPTILIDIRYAREDNFTKRILYRNISHVFLQKPAATKLVKAQRLLKEQDPSLSLMVFDGTRPRSVQHEMWEIVKGTDQQKYVANPYTGSIHNYGCAVDLSIVKNGTLLDMGTDYDFFGKLAEPRFNSWFLKKGQLTKRQVENRDLLRKIMVRSGFLPLEHEWWHFNAFSNSYVKENFTIIE